MIYVVRMTLFVEQQLPNMEVRLRSIKSQRDLCVLNINCCSTDSVPRHMISMHDICPFVVHGYHVPGYAVG